MIKSKNQSLKQRIKTRESGFTLVEVLAALTIFSIVGLATFTVMQRAVAARKLSKQKTERLMQVQQALAVLKADLSSIHDFSLHPFQGYQDSLRFTVLARRSGGVESGQYVAYFVKSSPEGRYKRLMRSTSDFYGNREEYELLTAVETIQFLYLQRQNNEARWTAHWSESEILPSAVQVRIFEPQAQEPMAITCPIRIHEKIGSQENEP